MPNNLRDRLMARVEEINAAQAEKDTLITSLQAAADRLRQIRELVAANKTITLTGLKALIDGIKALVEEGANGQ